MIYLSVKFDDFVSDEDGTWTQVCHKCSENYFKDHDKSEVPISDLVCGVESCSNEADYYLDFLCETTGQEKS